MGHIEVCRVCLAMDVKLYDLQSYPLGTYFEPVSGINFQGTVELPPFVCYECALLVKKNYFFRERCLRGQAALCGLLQSTGKLTVEDIKQIDRKYLHLTSNLSTYKIHENNTLHVIHDETTAYEIKEEPLESVEYSEKFELESDDLKEEDSIEDFPSSTNLTSDDNEPLSFHKSNKEKKSKKLVKKKERRKSKKECDDENDILTQTDVKIIDIEETNDDSIVETELNKLVLSKAKRGRPRKNFEQNIEVKEGKPRRTKNTGGVVDEEMDLEQYVTVIKLSIEEQIEEITKRQESSNFVNAPYQCNLCYKGFINTNTWKHHLTKHDPSAGDLECSVCKFRFKTKRTLQKHATNHEKKYSCKVCSYVSKTTTQAKQHQRWHKGVVYKCQYCDEISTKWTSYLSHVRIKHPSEFICGACGYSFVSRLGLAMHRTMMHKDLADKLETDDKESPYCKECDVKFITVEAWKRHMVTSVKHMQSDNFNNGCRECGETFQNPEELRLHHRSEHAHKRPKNYGKKPSNITWPTECEHCSEVIANARDYWTHFRRVHPDKKYPIQKNYVCDVCGKSFRGNAFLVYHKRTHSTERAYKCSRCPKAFFNRTNLQMHVRTHSDVRPHPCDVCGKAFKCKGALDRHFRSHTGVKPYECEVCGKAFAQSNSRKLHVRTVHLKQPSPYISRARLERRTRLAPHNY